MAFSPQRVLERSNSLSVTPALDPEVTRRLKQAREGRVDTVGNVTLTLTSTSTTVTHPAVSSTSFVGLMPRNANAAAENWWITPGNGTFTINHASAGTTRTFRFAIFTPSVA